MNIKQLFDLTGKTAVVTGGAGHLGRAMSEALAEAGARVVIASRDGENCRRVAEEQQQSTGASVVGSALDISSEKSVESSFQNIYSTNGSIDILVNNAAFASPGKFEEITEEAWLRGLDGTANGVFRCTKAVRPFMIEQESGSIINITSMYGAVSPDPSIYGDSGYDSPAAYGAGKAAVIQFTRHCACHLAEYGIRVNSISPGPFPSSEVQQNTEFIVQLNRKTPMNRIGKPHELKGAVLFLASAASSYITGVNITVDGGWSAW